jgi:DNA-binding GntR family transcriptional regulator
MDKSGTLRRNRITRAYDQLRELIVSGRLAPGTRVIESTFAERLGTSRTPVRGALQRLQQEGYVVATRGRKRTMLTVAPLTKEDGHELFWIVGELEGVAAHWVARLPAVDRDDVVSELTRINQDLLTASERSPADPGTIFDLHTRFHLCYVEACRGPRVQAMHQAVKPQAERYRRLYSMAQGGDIHASITEHEAIIQAVAEGDCMEAERAVKANWRNAAGRLEKLIEQVGERGSW